VYCAGLAAIQIYIGGKIMDKSTAVVIISRDGYWWMRERGTWRILISGKLPIPIEYSDYEVQDER
jgi:hypothetical protein